MRHRIRASALIVEDDRILLVQHVHPVSGDTWDVENDAFNLELFMTCETYRGELTIRHIQGKGPCVF